MSGYTLAEIAVWLVLAAVLGFVLGWLVRELVLRAHAGSAPRAAEPEPPAPAPEPELAAPEPEPEPSVPPVPAELPATPDGEPPTPEHRIKAKTRSRIYHPPGTPSYARTRADTWFRSEADAIAAGYRRPKNA